MTIEELQKMSDLATNIQANLDTIFEAWLEAIVALGVYRQFLDEQIKLAREGVVK